MKRTFLAAALAAASLTPITATPAAAQSQQDTARFDAAQRRFDNELRAFQAEFDRYQAAMRNRGGGYRDQRYDQQPQGYYPDAGDQAYYDPSRDYRDGPSYRERTLSNDDRVYRGTDGRYYCERSDGTTGLIIGGVGGAVLGNVIDGGRSRTVGTLLGGAIGALAGKSIEQRNSEVRCR